MNACAFCSCFCCWCAKKSKWKNLEKKKREWRNRRLLRSICISRSAMRVWDKRKQAKQTQSCYYVQTVSFVPESSVFFSVSLFRVTSMTIFPTRSHSRFCLIINGIIVFICALSQLRAARERCRKESALRSRCWLHTVEPIEAERAGALAWSRCYCSHCVARSSRCLDVTTFEMR